MKSHPTVAFSRSIYCVSTRKRSIGRGFTLLELLVVMVIIGILAAITLGAFRYAQESAARNRTVSAHGAIMAALEQYKEKFGEYPEPANPNEDDQFAGKTLHIGGAHMLYQAITADGNSAIELRAAPAGGVGESDGKVSDEEAENAITSSPLPKSIIFPPTAPAGSTRPRYLVDGWNRPFQYSKFDTQASANTTVNPTYDLWSLGPMTNGASATTDSIETKRDPTLTASWIKNW
jgi:prepilin-type N-terminal cleavage/methylation domain-containing protein